MPYRVARRPLARLLLIPLTITALGSVLGVVPAQVAEARPKLTVTTLATGLTIPWDITWVGDVMLFNERAGRSVVEAWPGRPKRSVQAPLTDLFVGSEAGLMGMVADPGARSQQTVLRLLRNAGQRAPAGRTGGALAAHVRHHGGQQDGGNPVVVSGFPISSGRHSGCRLRFGPDGKLYVGTGDAATGHQPAGPAVPRRQGAAGQLGRHHSTRQSVPRRGRRRPVVYTATATATSRDWPFGRAPRNCGPSSTGRTGTTRST